MKKKKSCDAEWDGRRRGLIEVAGLDSATTPTHSPVQHSLRTEWEKKNNPTQNKTVRTQKYRVDWSLHKYK